MCGNVWAHRKGKILLQIAIGFVSVRVWHVATCHMRDVDSQTVSVLLIKNREPTYPENNPGPKL